MKNIILVGFMGTGKTTIGKILSQKLNMEFIDTDNEISKKENMTISDIFESKGEDYFRNLETSILKKYLDKKGMILSTGGGIIERKCNIDLLKNIGNVIWLDGNKNTILNNLKNSKDERPLLKVSDVEKRIENLLNKRVDNYKVTSNIRIDINNKTIEEVIVEILLNLNKV